MITPKIGYLGQPPKNFKFWVWLAGTRLRRLALWLDYKIGDGGRKDPKWWWAGGGDRTLNK
jgi:hypothetical protein